MATDGVRMWTLCGDANGILNSVPRSLDPMCSQQSQTTSCVTALCPGFVSRPGLAARWLVGLPLNAHLLGAVEMQSPVGPRGAGNADNEFKQQRGHFTHPA